MVVAAWIIGIIVFILSLISLRIVSFVMVSIVVGFIVSALLIEFDPFDYLDVDVFTTLWGAFIGPWILVILLTALAGFFDFTDDVGKAIKNLADDDKRRY